MLLKFLKRLGSHCYTCCLDGNGKSNLSSLDKKVIQVVNILLYVVSLILNLMLTSRNSNPHCNLIKTANSCSATGKHENPFLCELNSSHFTVFHPWFFPCFFTVLYLVANVCVVVVNSMNTTMNHLFLSSSTLLRFSTSLSSCLLHSVCNLA